MEAAERPTAAASEGMREVLLAMLIAALAASSAGAEDAEKAKSVQPPTPPRQLMSDIDLTAPDPTAAKPLPKKPKTIVGSREDGDALWAPVLPDKLKAQPAPRLPSGPDDALWAPVPMLPKKLTSSQESPPKPVAKAEGESPPLLEKPLATAPKNSTDSSPPGETTWIATPKPPADERPRVEPRPLPRRDPVPTAQSAPVAKASPTKPDQAYRPLAAIVAQQAEQTPGTPNVWVSQAPQLPPPSADNVVVQQAPPDYTGPNVEVYSDATSESLWWSEELRFVALPGSLLWEPPLAGQREPRPFFKVTSLNDVATYDFAAGGQWGLGRWQPPGACREGMQIDVFAAAFTRFDRTGRRLATDYRGGIPLTYAKGPWQFKFAYEHTSSREDETAGRSRIDRDRDEAVLGIGYRWFEQVRTYGQAGYAFASSGPASSKRARFNVGVEWSEQCSTGSAGQPYSALNVEFREDRDYEADLTAQVGWQWRSQPTGRSARLAVEYYTGRSPFDVYYLQRENWFGFAASWDW